jgi:hypothetical protein
MSKASTTGSSLTSRFSLAKETASWRSRAALLVIVEVRRQTHESVPILVRLGGLRLELFNLVRPQRRRRRGHFVVVVRGFLVLCLFIHEHSNKP